MRQSTWARWIAGLLIVAAGAYVFTTRARTAAANATPAWVTEVVVRGDLEVSAEEANDLIMKARIHAGWIEAPVEPEMEEQEVVRHQCAPSSVGAVSGSSP